MLDGMVTAVSDDEVTGERAEYLDDPQYRAAIAQLEGDELGMPEGMNLAETSLGVIPPP